MVPPAVAREIGQSAAHPWMVRHALGQPIDPRVVATRLDPGEREAIALGLELSARLIVLDDLQARRLASRLGLRLTGTAGVLVTAKRLSLLSEVRSSLEALVASGCRISADVVEQALIQAGEAV